MPSRRLNSPLGIPAQENLELLEACLSKACPVAEMPRFDDLLKAINEADEKIGKCPTDY